MGRRWNGWGDETIKAELAPEARAFLQERLGAKSSPADASHQAVCDAIDRDFSSRLPAHPGIDRSAAARLAAGVGQSCGDWIRLRFGRLERITDGVVFPEHEGELRQWLDWAAENEVIVIPCGGATSVAGHLAAPAGDRPVLTMKLERMRRLLSIDPVSQLARFEAGVMGPDLEAQLRAHGFMLGHAPQSFEFASLGGWIATRSSGQQSLRYGRIEQLFAGGRLLTPGGSLDLPPFPASAAGPDWRETVLGSEGRIGVLSEAVVRISPLPEAERFVGVFLPDWQSAVAAVRQLVQSRCALSMLRLANPVETFTTLKLAGHAGAIAWLERYLAWRGAGAEKCLLFMGLTGTGAQVAGAAKEAGLILRAHGGVSTGTLLGKKWEAKRFAGVYLRNALWEAGYAVDTMETALPWSGTDAMVAAIEEAGQAALARHGERCHVYTHLSHVYASGSSVYSTFVFRVGPDFESTWSRWRDLKSAVSEAIVKAGGTISHQHGVGKDHAPYLEVEKGETAMAALAAIVNHFDPQAVLASGNLLGART